MDFTKNQLLKNNLIIMCRKYSEQMFLRRLPDRYFELLNSRLMFRQLTDLIFKSLSAIGEISIPSNFENFVASA